MQNFQVIKSLGEGAFSTVFKVKRISDGQEYALKKVKMGKLSEKEKQNALNEVRILASIQHPNIISYKESFLEERTSTLCIVMEYADGGDLLQKITQSRSGKAPKIPEQTIWSYFIQMLHGLQALHDRQIVHRDIKCANLFLTKQGVLKLGDLNVSKVAKRGLLQTQTGTPYYASPEVWQDKPYDHKSDIWSLGCVLYEACALQPPFRANDMNQLFKRVCEGRIPPLPAQYSKDLMYMIKLCLQLDPKLRPNCPEMLSKNQLVRNTPSQLSLSLEQAEDLKLIGTIRVPRNLGQITDRLPAANYDPESQSRLNRQSSLPSMRPSELAKQQQPMAAPVPGSAVSKGRGGSLATIKERDEAIRSADPNYSKSRQMHQAAQQMAVKNQASGYNANNGRQPRRVQNLRSQVDVVAQHRSPVLPSGKENLQLPPIDPSGRQRNGGVSASRQDPISNLRNNGAAIMGTNSSSARNLNSYRSGSRNGSDGVRDSMNMGQKKYQGANYQQQVGASRQYVKGQYYGVELQPPNQLLSSPRMSEEPRPTGLGSRMSPRNQGAQAYQQAQYAQMAGRPPRPEMFMGTPASNYQQAYGSQAQQNYGAAAGRRY